MKTPGGVSAPQTQCLCHGRIEKQLWSPSTPVCSTMTQQVEAVLAHGNGTSATAIWLRWRWFKAWSIRFVVFLSRISRQPGARKQRRQPVRNLFLVGGIPNPIRFARLNCHGSADNAITAPTRARQNLVGAPMISALQNARQPGGCPEKEMNAMGVARRNRATPAQHPPLRWTTESPASNRSEPIWNNKNRTRKQYGFSVCLVWNIRFHTSTNRIHFARIHTLIYLINHCRDKKYSG